MRGGAALQLTIACSILLSMATTLAPEALEESGEAGGQHRTPPFHRGPCTATLPPHQCIGASPPKGINESRHRSRVPFTPGAAMPPPTSSIGGRSGPPGTPGRPFPRISVANGGGTTAHRGCPYLLSSFTETTSPPSREEKKEMEKLWSW